MKSVSDGESDGGYKNGNSYDDGDYLSFLNNRFISYIVVIIGSVKNL